MALVAVIEGRGNAVAVPFRSYRLSPHGTSGNTVGCTRRFELCSYLGASCVWKYVRVSVYFESPSRLSNTVEKSTSHQNDGLAAS